MSLLHTAARVRTRLRGDRAFPVIGGGAIAGLAIAVGLVGYSAFDQATALPSFARQTGQPCMGCHTAFPELTPFGRRFKLGGYTLGGGVGIEDGKPPVAVIAQPAFMRTDRRQDAPPTTDSHTNNNVAMQDASIFYAGRVYGNLGAFLEFNYDRPAQRFVPLANADIRYADSTKLGGLDILYGVTAHNNPTLQDVWNTTPVWSFPWSAASLAPQFSPPGTQIEGNHGSKVLGASVYTMLNDTVYLEAGGYRNMPLKMRRALNVPCSQTDMYVNARQQLDALNPFNNPPYYPWYGPQGLCASDSMAGFAPYWRVAIEPNWGDHSLMVGAFGFLPRVYPGSATQFGADRYRDIGFDMQYQYITDLHAVSLKLSHIVEHQTLQSTFGQGVWANALGMPPLTTNGGSSNLTNTLTSFRATAQYVWDRTVMGSVSYFNVYGSNDAVIYGSSLTGSPNGKGLTFEIGYMPFMKGGPALWPWANARIGLQYTHYLQMYGGNTNFDGAFHNAKDNNTLLLYTWIAF